MKRVICWILMVLLIVAMTVTAYASEVTSCIVSADSVIAAGDQVTVAIRIADNPGFTNLGIALDYDREQLTLLSINAAENDIPYLCGSVVSVNTAWADEDGIAYGYVTCASADAVVDEGILFTATFEVSDDFTETASITPVVKYIRNNAASFSIFEEITATVQEGAVIERMAGDLNFDGVVEMTEVAQVLRVYSGLEESEAVLNSVDVDKDDVIELNEVAKVIRNYQSA